MGEAVTGDCSRCRSDEWGMEEACPRHSGRAGEEAHGI